MLQHTKQMPHYSSNLQEECRQHMRNNDIIYDGEIVTDGNCHRFSADNKKNKKDEWYFATEGESRKGNSYLVVTYGSWSTDKKYTYISWLKSETFDNAEKKEMELHFESYKSETDKKLVHNYKQAAIEAEKIWKDSYKDAPSTEYLNYPKSKGIEPIGVRFAKNPSGYPSVLIPIQNINNQLITIQFISCGNGSKKSDKTFLSGGKKKGNFHIIDGLNIKDTDHIYVVEGWATGVSIYIALDKKNPVVVALDAGNIESVVKNIRKKYQKNQITIAGDSDKNEKGKSTANSAAKLFDCSVVFPNFPAESTFTDFNDLLIDSGVNEIRDQLKNNLVTQLPMLSKKNEKLGLHNMNQEKVAKITPAQKTGFKYKHPKTLEHALEENIIIHFADKPITDSKILTLDPTMFTGNTYKEGKEIKSLNQDIVKALIKCCEEGIASTPIDISTRCKKSAKTYSLLYSLSNKTIDPESIDGNIKKLKLLHGVNRLQKQLDHAKDNEIPFNDLADNLRVSLDLVQSSLSEIYPQDHYLDSILIDIKTEKDEMIATGIKSLDNLLGGGFVKASLTSLTGGAGSGKTALALQIADSIAQKDKPVLYISMEIKRSKITERSLKSICRKYPSILEEKDLQKRIHLAAEKYRKFCKNIRIIEGHEGMSLNELRSIILSTIHEVGSDLLVIIDPFQRLGTGDPNLDSLNETLKVNKLCSGIKRLANDYNIPILMLADTTKNHKSNQSGEGSARGSYMIDHTVDLNLMIRTNRKSPLKAMFGEIPKEDDKATELFPFLDQTRRAINKTINKLNNKDLKEWDKWASIVTSKNRDGLAFNPLFIYRPAYHYFQEIDISGIYKQERIL